jgi:signal transduction histidine kinase
MTDSSKIPILLVDDRPENLIALEELLNELPFNLALFKAGSGQEALRLSLKRDYALLLLDVQMPVMDGLETAELLRASPKTRHLPIVFVTAGMTERGHLFKGYELGAVDYLVKPIDPVILRSKARAFCELYARKLEIELRKANLESEVRERTSELSALAEKLTEEIKVRRTAEEALRTSEMRMREELETLLEERTRDLKHATEQLVESEKLASLGRVVAGVAHELSTPIGNMLTIASTLCDKITDITRIVHDGATTRSALVAALDECRQASVTIVRSSQRSDELIESFKQIAVDQASQRRRTFDLRDTIADILNTIGTTMRHGHATCDLNIPHGINMDSFPGHLEQIFNNLILNSIFHGFESKGGGHITIEAKEQDGEVQIVYQDDGVGIAQDHQRLIFEPFYTTRLGKGGSGLGMFIVHNLVRSGLKGNIKLQSELGKGVRFTFCMPATTPTEPPHQAG